MDEHIFLFTDRCEGLGTITFQTEDNGGPGNSRGYEHVVVAQVGFVIELVAGVTDETKVDLKNMD